MIRAAIREIVKDEKEVYSLVCEVLSIDENERTCEVQPKDGKAKIFNVRFQAGINGNKGFFFLPKIGSDVVVSMINEDLGFVSLTSEIDKVIVSVSNMTFEFSEDGLKMSSEISDLKSEMERLIDELKSLIATIKALQFTTTSGTTTAMFPTSILSLNLHDGNFEDIKQKMNSFLA